MLYSSRRKDDILENGGGEKGERRREERGCDDVGGNIRTHVKMNTTKLASTFYQRALLA